MFLIKFFIIACMSMSSFFSFSMSSVQLSQNFNAVRATLSQPLSQWTAQKLKAVQQQIDAIKKVSSADGKILQEELNNIHAWVQEWRTQEHACIDRCNKEVEELKTKEHAHKRSNDELAANIKKIKAQSQQAVDNEKKNVEQLRREIKAKSDEIARLKSSPVALPANDALNQRVKELTEALEVRTKEWNQQMHRADGADKMLIDANKKLWATEEELKNTKGKLDPNIKQKIKQLEQKLDRADNDVNMLEGQLEVLKKEHRKNEEVIKNLRDTNKNLVKQNRELTAAK